MRAVIVTGNGVQDQEYTYPLYRLDEAGWEVDVATHDGRACEGFLGVKVHPTKTFSELSAGYDLVVVPGGVKSMEHMRLNKILLGFIVACYLNGKVIASICSGPMLLISAGIVKGKRMACYPAWRVDLENAGAEYVDAPAVVHERIVTSPHYRHVGPWMAATLTAVQYPNGFQ